MKVSRNQVVWARCHLAGDASSIDWTVASASDSGATSASVSARTFAKRVASASVAGRGSDFVRILFPFPERAGQSQAELRSRRIAGRARNPQNVTTRVFVHAPRGYEQIVRQAVEIGKRERIQRDNLRCGDRSPLCAAARGPGEVERGGTGGACGQDEAGERGE